MGFAVKKIKGPLTITWTNLVRLESPMLYTKIQPQSFLGSYLGMAAILFNCAEQIGNIRLREDPIWNLVKIAQTVSDKKTFKKYTILYMYIAQGQWQITLWDKIFSFSH